MHKARIDGERLTKVTMIEGLCHCSMEEGKYNEQSIGLGTEPDLNSNLFSVLEVEA